MKQPITMRSQRTAYDPEAYVAAFGETSQWGFKTWTVRLVEVLPGLTKSGRKRFVIEFTEVVSS